MSVAHQDKSPSTQALQRLHPGAWADEWSDKLAESEFFSANQRSTFEHYVQVLACAALSVVSASAKLWHICLAVTLAQETFA